MLLAEQQTRCLNAIRVQDVKLFIQHFMSQQALNSYKVMWIMVFFDLPTETKKQRKVASKFRKELLNDGFSMFQFSIYLRHCSSRDNGDVHIKRVKQSLPEYGHVGIIKITDKQFGAMELFQAQKTKDKPQMVQQLELF